MEVGKDIPPPGEKSSDAANLGVVRTSVKSDLGRRPPGDGHQSSSLDKLVLGTHHLGASIENNGIFFQGNGGKNGVCDYQLYDGESSSQNVQRPAEGWTQYVAGNYSTTTVSAFAPFVFAGDAANSQQYPDSNFMLLNGKVQLDPQFFSDSAQLPRLPSDNDFAFRHPPNNSIHHFHQITQRKVESSKILDQLSPITPHKSDGTGNERMNKRSMQNDDTTIIGGNKPVETCFSQEALYPEIWSSVCQRNHDQVSNSQYIHRNKFISSAFEPVTPDKYKTMWNFQSLRTNVIVDNTKAEENKEKQTDNGQAYIKHIETHDDFSEQSNLLSVTTRLSSEQQNLIQDTKHNQEIELTNTPAQKSRRKRHRPKVVVEGKSVRKPRQMTPESATTPENTTGKRKYTRRNKEPSLKAPSSELRETTGPVKKRGRRPTKRALNFDSEEQKQDEFQPSPTPPEINIDQDVSRTISNIKSVPNIAEAIENAVHPSAKILTDLEHSMNQGSNICIRLQEDQTSITQSSIRNIPRDNIKDIAKQRRLQSSSDHIVPSESQEAKQSTIESRKNKCYDVDHDSFIHLPELFHVNVLLGNFDPRITHNKLGHLPEICKRRRTDNRHNRFLSIKSDSKALEHHNNLCELFSFEDTQRIKAHERRQAVHFTIQKKYQKMMRTSEATMQQKHQKTRQTSEATIQDDKLISRITGAVRCQSPSIQRSSQAHDQRCEVTRMEALTEYASLKVPRRRRTKKINNVESASLKVPRKRRTKNLNKTDPMEILIQNLKRLDINRVSTPQSLQQELALIPYSGGGAMVPFMDQLDPSRQRRPRAKVNLDSETNRVWMLLMGNECGKCPGGTDIDKEKWWEEERRVFQGRADSFIARMHLVQGDRRFSKWKGTVVDSVVGVFLTQNVSDHLSSSAFMAMAARFPCQSRGKNCDSNISDMIVSKVSRKLSTSELEDKEDKSILNENKFHKVAALFQRDQHIKAKESAEENESLEKDVGPYTNPFSRVEKTDEAETRIDLPEERKHTSSDQTGTINFFETDDMISTETVVSSQNSVNSSHNSSNSPINATDRTGMILESNSIIDDIAPESEQNNLDASTPFLKLLQMAETSKLQDLYQWNDELFGSNVVKLMKSEKIYKTNLRSEQQCKLIGASPSEANCDSYKSGEQHHFTQTSFPFSTTQFCSSNGYKYATLDSVNVERDNEVASLSSVPEEKWMHVNINGPTANNKIEAVNKRDLANAACSTAGCDPCTEIRDESIQTLPYSRGEACLPACFPPVESMVSSVDNDTSIKNPGSHTAELQRNESEIDLLEKRHASLTELYKKRETKVHESESESTLYTSTSIVQEHMNLVEREGVSEVPNKSKTKDSADTKTSKNAVETKQKRVGNKRNDDIDWDVLRKEVWGSDLKKERNSDTLDSVDWEAVRCADVSEISNTIRERGMNNMLAERIKAFLNRLVRDHGSIDLEWLREVSPEKVKDYLLSVRGLGLKSVECVRLLTLHHLAFPVDTNVGRICVRLGWVPLQPLPESLQLHLLELYPVLETIQKYLWPRLCKLDQRTLYELHYQMITFGKVFCTKSKPNCNACPMRGECRHFASAFASARLALPGPEEKSLVRSDAFVASEHNFMLATNHKSLPLIEEFPISQRPALCVPIIEEPATPEPECMELLESAIEDAFYEDPDEIPEIKLNLKQFTQNLQNIMQENNMELQDDDLSKALIAITPEVASIPQPKLKNINRLRTEHLVYELPDSHPLLEQLDQREPDDPCPYLLAIWTPGETAQSTGLPGIMCSSQGTGNLCDNKECFACNSIREVQAQKVRGTLLIPCRTAMRGSFPLNGTYFQVNEVFADHCSSLSPMDVPREWIWNLPRRTVYFGTSIPTIFKGLTTEGIQQCFWRGFVCVRGFDQKTRAPRPLLARLHFPASKALRNRRTSKKEEIDHY